MKLQKSEYPHESVPLSERQPTWKLFIVTIGFTAVAVNMIVGGTLGRAMPPQQWFTAIVIGGLLLAGIAGFTAWYSYRTGLTFALQTVAIFGPNGSRLVSAIVGLIILGWYTIQASLLGHVIATYLEVAPNTELLLLFLTPCILAITAIIGFRGLAAFSIPAVPAIFILAGIAIYTAQGNAHLIPTGEIGWSQALTIVIGLWVTGAVATIGDVTRFAAAPKSAVLSTFIGFLLGNTVLMLAGAWASSKYGIGDLSEVLRASGLPLLGVLLLITNIWTTNDNSIYSVALNWAHTLNTRFRILVGLFAIFSGVISLTRPYESAVLAQWLTGLGILVPSLGGVIIGARLSRKSIIPPYIAWSGLVIGIAISWLNPLGLAPIWGLVVASLWVLILGRVAQTSSQPNKASN